MCGAIGSTILGVGQVIDAFSGYRQGKAEAAAYQSQARVDEHNAQKARARAEDASLSGRLAATDYREEARGLKGAQKAAASASGLDASAGSAAAGQAALALKTSREVGHILTNAQRERQNYEDNAVGHLNQAAGYQAAAKNAKTAARGSLFSGLLGATTSILGADWGSSKAKDKDNLSETAVKTETVATNDEAGKSAFLPKQSLAPFSHTSGKWPLAARKASPWDLGKSWRLKRPER